MNNNREMNRRRFLKLSATGAVAAGASALVLNSENLLYSTNIPESSAKIIQNDTKKIFREKGT